MKSHRQGDACRQRTSCPIFPYNFFVLEVVKAWIDPARTHPKTIHHLGKGNFMVAGKRIKLPSKMK